MDPWVGAGTALAVLLIVLRCIGPRHWNHPRRWHIPDTGAVFLIFVGAYSITEAIKVGRLLTLGRIVVSSGRSKGPFTSVSAEDTVFFIGGVAAGLIVGMISIRDGLGKLIDDDPASSEDR